MKRELIVAEEIAEEAARRIVALQPRTIVLAGGSTPRRLYERLVTCDLPWHEIDVFFSDERCVPPDHPASNYGMAAAALLDHVPARVHRMPSERCDPEAYEAALTRVFGPGLPTFDLVLLGLGEDGHTASLFPGHPALEERTKCVVRVERPDVPRLTLALPVLSAAKVALFLVEGARKREALRRLLADEAIPAAQVRARRVVVIADKAAAGVEAGGAQ